MAAAQGPFYKELGKRIRDARNARKLTQSDLASVVGLSRTSITNIEKGRQPIDVLVFCRFADVLGSSPAQLLPINEPIEAESLPIEIRRMDPRQQKWIARIVGPAALRNEDEYARKVFTRKKESSGAAANSRSKKRAGPSRKTGRHG